MYKYEDIILPYITGEYKINDKGELNFLCPFHHETHPSFNINLESGLYNCFSCGEKGNIYKFLSLVTDLTKEEIKKIVGQNEYSNSSYTLEMFANEKQLDIDKLKLWGVSNGYNCIQIPYYNENHERIATRYRYNPNENKNRFSWKKGSKISLYGLNSLQYTPTNEYIVIVEGESDTMTLWNYQIPAVGVPRCK